jgi:CheY-like chemotaxis protein
MKRRVLIADDDRFMVQTLCDVLAYHGWSAQGADSAEQAFEMIEQEDFGCVIMDIQMSGEDGYSALQRIKRRNSTVPVVLMTAYTPDELVADARRKGLLRNVDDSESPQLIANLIRDTHDGGESLMVFSHDASLLTSVEERLTTWGLRSELCGWSTDFIAQFERQRGGITLVVTPRTDPVVHHCTLITALDAGVWAALSGSSPTFAHLETPSIKRADRMLRKPFAIPLLVKQLDAFLAA